MKIIEDRLESSAVLDLLREHLEDMNATSPAESVHALDVSGLKEPSVTFWSSWQGEQLLGCAALKALSHEHGELKSMRTATLARKMGVGSTMLRHILDYARQQGMTKISLETGSMAYFAPARALYEKHGFEYCEPFADYTLDPNSQFMSITL
ncbi:histone acetyltransferase HPA2 [Vibrio orientalis CIP 102891 = ATCC 33934]|uniref:Histone acetyltransferase HPA2 n=2 Tax=Vibrio orientalis CIP 102891 = ATCC 33934 TaxID=675816 RepID=F9SMJ5_VIBOR|nr:GNAT family N-acetyltransferase [Vibrio orientalis]EGU54050.1 histone acetyltransferase HPA2 [Vibrio orientalis CIP 102891 = ATCC 33934]